MNYRRVFHKKTVSSNGNITAEAISEVIVTGDGEKQLRQNIETKINDRGSGVSVVASASCSSHNTNQS